MNLLVFVGYGSLVALLSLLPPGDLGPGQWDKLAHFSCYALFAVLAFRVAKRGNGFLALCLGIVIYGGLLEYAQSLTPDRMMSTYDFLANTLGVIVGGLVAPRLVRG